MYELFLDTDILIKFAAYGLFEVTRHPHCECECDREVAFVDAARFVARSKLKKRATNFIAAKQRLEAFLKTAIPLEPTPEELKLAAELEEEASRGGVDLDVGESQLCAIAIHRERPIILTGDKRAIVAVEQLISSVSGIAALSKRLACLEQAAMLAVERLGAVPVRARVVSEPNLDRTMNICFQSTNPSVGDNFFPSGLLSYIRALREEAPTALLPGESLKTV